MRSEKEMMGLIVGFAQAHEDVRAAVMTGSRTNPAAAPDPFQDYDVTYLVRDVAPYRQNQEVPRYFGELMILQTPDDMGDEPGTAASYAFLMQFADGNRIDLTFRDPDGADLVAADSLSVVLVDKDRQFALPPPTLRSYLPRAPAARQFADCCNEFWWLNPYVAKGLYRDQIPYAKGVLDGPMREQLTAMLAWHVGLKTNFEVSIGYLGKHLKTHLAGDLWELVEHTYCDGRREHIWQALFAMDELFRTMAWPLAAARGFHYPEREDTAVSAFIRRIRDAASAA